MQASSYLVITSKLHRYYSYLTGMSYFIIIGEDSCLVFDLSCSFSKEINKKYIFHYKSWQMPNYFWLENSCRLLVIFYPFISF